MAVDHRIRAILTRSQDTVASRPISLIPIRRNTFVVRTFSSITPRPSEPDSSPCPPAQSCASHRVRPQGSALRSSWSAAPTLLDPISPPPEQLPPSSHSSTTRHDLAIRPAHKRVARRSHRLRAKLPVKLHIGKKLRWTRGLRRLRFLFLSSKTTALIMGMRSHAHVPCDSQGYRKFLPGRDSLLTKQSLPSSFDIALVCNA